MSNDMLDFLNKGYHTAFPITVMHSFTAPCGHTSCYKTAPASASFLILLSFLFLLNFSQSIYESTITETITKHLFH